MNSKLQKVASAVLQSERIPFSIQVRCFHGNQVDICVHRFGDPSKIAETADKLRWYRYKNALRQRDVAKAVGTDRTTCKRYEEAGYEYHPGDVMEKIAALFGVPVEELLDNYNLFLYRDQGRQIQEKRLELGMTQREYADRLGVPYASLGRWERNKMRIAKGTWEKMLGE